MTDNTHNPPPMDADFQDFENDEPNDLDEDEISQQPKRSKRIDNDSLYHMFLQLSQQSTNIQNQLHKLNMLDEIKSTLEDQKTTITNLSTAVATMDQEVTQLKNENERLEKELKKCNLIFSGISDDQNEDESVCLDKIKQQINHLKVRGVTLDTAHRLGTFKIGTTRSIKVKFLKLSDRQKVWDARKNLPSPVYINEDLPQQTRRHHYILREAARDAKSKNKSVRIKCSTKENTIDEKVFKIENDALVDSSPTNAAKKKKDFLGKRPLQTRNMRPNTSQQNQYRRD